MKASTIRLIVAAYFGFALSFFANLNALNWRFYVIIVPVVLGYGIAFIIKDKNDKSRN